MKHTICQRCKKFPIRSNASINYTKPYCQFCFKDYYTSHKFFGSEFEMTPGAKRVWVRKDMECPIDLCLV
jgi:hypothetical protein